MARYIKCFEIVHGGYREIPFSQLVQNGKRNPNYENRFFANWHGYLMEMTKEDYLEFYKNRRRQKYIKEEAIRRKEISYNAIDDPELCGEELIKDIFTSTEDDAINAVMLEKLHKVMRQLTLTEAELIGALYFQRQSERDYSVFTGIPQKTINDRKHRILLKIKKLMEI